MISVSRLSTLIYSMMYLLCTTTEYNNVQTTSTMYYVQTFEHLLCFWYSQVRAGSSYGGRVAKIFKGALIFYYLILIILYISYR